MLIPFLVACGTVAAPAPAAPPAPSYADVIAGIEADRSTLAARHAAGDATALTDARERALHALADEVFPAWAGTRWEFYGTTRTPREGAIACGYFVSTTLRDAGFAVERVTLAQQPAEHIIKTVVPSQQIRRYRTGDVDAVIDGVVADGPGLYLVGLDFHVGYLHHDGHTVRMCHSSYLPPGSVTCEPAREAAAMVSGYHVVGKLLETPMLEAWLTGAALPTVVWR